jgi:hypothetical protein
MRINNIFKRGYEEETMNLPPHSSALIMHDCSQSQTVMLRAGRFLGSSRNI